VPCTPDAPAGRGGLAGTEGRHVRNVVLRDLDPDDRTGHAAEPYDPAVLNVVREAPAK
jgi:hypothetical protein